VTRCIFAGQVGPAELGVVEPRPRQVLATQVGPGQFQLAQVRPDQRVALDLGQHFTSLSVSDLDHRPSPLA
jgi:hypothetical protein